MAATHTMYTMYTKHTQCCLRAQAQAWKLDRAIISQGTAETTIPPVLTARDLGGSAYCTSFHNMHM